MSKRFKRAIEAMMPRKPKMTPVQFPMSADGASALDYSGMTCANGQLYVFGGGHAASACPDVWRLDEAAGAFVSDYKTLTRDKMTQSALSPSKWWHVDGYPLQPIAPHSYSGFLWASKAKRIVKIPGSNGSPYDFGFPPPSVCNDLVGGTMGHYDPATKTWEELSLDLARWPTVACCEDPVAGLILAVQNDLWAAYDPSAKAFRALDSANTRQHIGYDDCLMYYPPNDRFYFVTRKNWTTGGGPPQVVELLYDRNAPQQAYCSEPLPLTRPGGTGDLIVGTAQYAYDPDSQMIVGGLEKDRVWAVQPVDGVQRKAGWYYQDVPGAGTMNFHHWAFDSRNNRHFVINTDRLCHELRLPANAWQPATTDGGQPPDEEQAAVINDGAFSSLEDAANAGVPLTISAGVLYTGAAITKEGTTSIAGAGADKTRIIGGGAVWGKGALVFTVPSHVSGIAFEDVINADGNGAGIRHDSGHGLMVADCKFTRCQDGYLGNASVEFNRCRFVDCGDGSGQTHGVYVSHGAAQATANDCVFTGTKIGHHFKSRSERSTLHNCTMEAATESYSANFPWGGVVNVDHCQMTKGPNANNDMVISFGEESDNPLTVHSLTLTDCVLTSSYPNTTGIRVSDKVGTPPVMLRRVAFNGIANLVTGGVVTYEGCTKDGAPIPDTNPPGGGTIPDDAVTNAELLTAINAIPQQTTAAFVALLTEFCNWYASSRRK